MHELIGFLGGGNMASGLVGGLRAAGHPAERIMVVELDPARRQQIANRFGVQLVDATALSTADVVILAVKPQQLREALAGVSVRADATVISIAAGIACESLREWLGGRGEIVRTMPNTPAMVGAGATGLFAPAETSARSRERAERLLGCVGIAAWVDRESLLDAVTAVSGSGPAYFFLLTEAMEAAGVALGLSADAAAVLARQTLIGAGRLAQSAPEPISTLRTQVTSPGGTTFAAVSSLEKAGFLPMISQALEAASHRSRELGDAARAGR